MSIQAPTITPELYQYLLDSSWQENEIQAQLREETLSLPNGKMMSAPEQTQFLSMLIKLINATRIIEIGTFTGYATLAMALATKGQVITCDLSKEAPQLGQKYWEKAGILEKIQLHITSGLSLLDKLIKEKAQFDLAFIDADKKNNHHYYEKLLSLIRPNGLIIIDNIFWQGKVINASDQEGNTQAIRNFNKALKEDDRIDVCIIPLGDGMTLARVK